MDFKENHVGVLDEAKVFINFMTSKTPYVNNLVFQGSNDDWTTFTDLYTFKDDVHEGWNYIQFREFNPKPAYHSYRFYGKVAGSCRVTEFKLIGVQAIADTNTEYTCTPQVHLSGSMLDLGAITVGDVTYADSVTPLVTSFSPRFGSVLGGT